MQKLVPVLALALTSACATIMQGSKQNVGMSSTPSGAAIFVDNQQVGSTPATVPISRKGNHVVRLDLPGYQPYEVALAKKTSGWVWGNIVFGGIPGLIVDAVSGGLYKLTPEDVNATLVRGTTATVNSANDQLQIRVVFGADPSWQKIGQLTTSTSLGGGGGR